MNKKNLFSSILYIFLFFVFLGCTKSNFDCNKQDQKIVILFTNDVHCAVNQHMGYAGLKAYKNECEKETPYVALVDSGDFIQGDLIGFISKGEYIIEIMNKVGYDVSTLGNHEFDYGIENLTKLIKKAKFPIVVCNVTSTSTKETFLSNTKPYILMDFGKTRIAFIGVTTPYSISTSNPKFFQEDGKFVYDFCAKENGKQLYGQVQKTVNEAKQNGATYVIALTHLGSENKNSDSKNDDNKNEINMPFSCESLIKNTYGLDAVLDGHSHSIIPEKFIKNKIGNKTLLSSTGARFLYIGKLTINITDKKISSTLINFCKKKDIKTSAFINKIQKKLNKRTKQVIFYNNAELSIFDENGQRIVRKQECPLANLITDAYKNIMQSDIAIVNGGTIRSNIPAGKISYKNFFNILPFSNEIITIEASGRQILDALEFSAKDIPNEFGGFLQVSGLKYTIDSSIKTPIITDENGMLKKIEGKRRIKNVMVFDNNKYISIIPEKKYIVAGPSFIFENGGDGNTVFMNSKIINKSGITDMQVLISYVNQSKKMNINNVYNKTEQRITIE
ncbi:MAG: bifunctional metallophosphatase/5'-nucleotidase [Treponemataceae bacterium]